jgi:hypothetical protein
MAKISGTFFKTKNERSSAEQYGIDICFYEVSLIERKNLY